MRAGSLVLVGLLSMTGCGLPPAVVIGSYAADGASYLATGKTVSDHGLSAATAEDCAVIGHLAKGQPICAANTARGRDVPVVQGKKSMPPEGVVALSSTPVERYVTIGSFPDVVTAKRAAQRFAALDPIILPGESGGKRFHRVIVGPLSPEAAARLEARLAAEEGRPRPG